MLKATILVCSVLLPDCTPGTSTSVVRLDEEFNNPVTCFLHAQAYLADTTLVHPGEKLAILCMPKKETWK